MPLRFNFLHFICLLGTLTTSASAAEISNKAGITMVDIPAGSFVMGSCKLSGDIESENKKRAFMGQDLLPGTCPQADMEASDYETPQHKVTLRKFQLSKTEVTLGQFKKFIASAQRNDLINQEFIKYNTHADNAPVVMVNWQDAQDFIAWLNKTEGGGYRLPSEAEWEYACRAGAKTQYCGSDQVDEVAWHLNNAGQRMQAVATKKPNKFGLHDMSGNVLEWVQDCWNPNYRGAPTDGSAWTRCVDGYQVQRGGSWIDESKYLRSAARQVDSPGSRGNDSGFRVARTSK